MFCGIPLKLNYMALRGYNEQDYRWLVRRYVRFFPVRLRFLELMPVGCARELQELGVPNSEILQQLRQDYPRLYSLPPAQSAAFGDGPAVYYTNPGWAGSVGFISPVHGKEPFCTRCNRVRLSASGFLRPWEKCCAAAHRMCSCWKPSGRLSAASPCSIPSTRGTALISR